MKSELTVTVLGMKTKMELNWADGMVGAIPVFATKEQAEAYADGTGICELIMANEKE